MKLGAKGSALFIKGEEPIKQPIISASKVLDTTGAGDTFTAAFAIALVEGKSQKDCMKFAGVPFLVKFFYTVIVVLSVTTFLIHFLSILQLQRPLCVFK